MTENKQAHTAHPLNPLLQDRWSPRAFDPDTVIPTQDIETILEAARWSPSAANIQPWRFVVGSRHSQEFNTILGSLSRGNSSWADKASVLILAIAVTESEDGDMQRWSEYDLGQAVAHLSLQAHSMGYNVHQMGGFNVEALKRDFNLEDRYEPFTVIAIGRIGNLDQLPERYRESEHKPRVRKDLNEIIICGLPATSDNKS